MTAFLMMLSLIAPPAKHDTGWRGRDKALLIVSSVAIVADCASTAYALHRDSLTFETNPMLGPHPSTFTLASACALGVGLTWVTAAVLPKKLRPFFLLGVTAVELGATAQNLYKIGFKFPV